MSIREGRVLRLPSALILGALLAGLGTPARMQAQNAIDFTLKDQDGREVRLGDYLGNSIILIDFWATWCVPCVKELPHFQRFHDSYAERGLKVFAVTVDGPETVAMVKPFLQRYKYSFEVLLDVESRVIALYNPRVVLPYTVLIDRQGRIRHVHQGYSPGDEVKMEEELLELLEEEPAGRRRGFSLSVNEAFLNRIFSDDDYVESTREGRRSQVINRLDLNLTRGDWLAGIRLDANLDWSPWRDEYALAKRFVEYQGRNFGLRAGDYYYSMGRGLMFSVLKTFEKEGLEYIIDTTVDGGKLALRTGPLSVEAFGGWLDREESDLKDRVFGGSLGFQAGETAGFKLNLLGSRLEPGSLQGNRDVTMQSFSLDVPNLGDVTKFYGEFLLIQKDKYYTDEHVTGHGVYLESGLFLGNLTMLFEFKDYLNLDFEYSRPPLLESELLPEIANQFAKDAKDITGIAGRIDYSLPAIESVVWGKLTYFHDSPDGFVRDIWHVYGGGEKKFGETGWLNLLAGYRSEATDSMVFYYTHGDTAHYQFNLSYPLNSRLSVELDIKGKRFDGRHIDYFEQRSFFSLHYSRRWILTLLFDRTDDPQVLFFKNKKDWLGAQLEIKFSQANSIRLFYGANKGGVKCSGGVCKFFPPYEGFRLDAMLRF